MEQIFENIYRIGVPLPGSPLRELSCWFVKGLPGERNLMVDCGFNNDACEQAVRAALDELGCTMDDTDIFLTHLHADHTGLCGRLKTVNNRVYIRACDGARVNGFLTDVYWDNMRAFLPPMGVPEADRMDVRDHPAYKNRISAPVEFTDVNDGWRISVGGYHFEAVDLAGHTPGQLGLWEREKKFMISGDHVLARITPNICLWDYDNDYLAIYLRNLKKVKTMQLDTLLTAHRKVITEVDARIDELTAHHARRLDEICNILESGDATVWQLAHAMHWDFGTGNFADFPPSQRWFALLEVFAHAEHLRRIEKVSCDKQESGWLYHMNH